MLGKCCLPQSNCQAGETRRSRPLVRVPLRRRPSCNRTREAAGGSRVLKLAGTADRRGWKAYRAGRTALVNDEAREADRGLFFPPGVAARDSV
jgi:hypothetical protein